MISVGIDAVIARQECSSLPSNHQDTYTYRSESVVLVNSFCIFERKLLTLINTCVNQCTTAQKRHTGIALATTNGKLNLVYKCKMGSITPTPTADKQAVFTLAEV